MRLALIACTAMLAAAPAAFAAAPDQALVDLEAKWSQAYVSKDTATIQSIVDPSWTEQGPGGPSTAAGLLDDVKTGKLAIKSMTNHDVHARVFGNIAVVQGADTETSAYAGKDTSGEYTWTDVFQKHHGKWMAVASQVTKAK